MRREADHIGMLALGQEDETAMEQGFDSLSKRFGRRHTIGQPNVTPAKSPRPRTVIWSLESELSAASSSTTTCPVRCATPAFGYRFL